MNTKVKVSFQLIILFFLFHFHLSAQKVDSIIPYNSPHLKATLTTTITNISLNRVNRYVLPSGREWADVNWASWKKNLKLAPQWDWDLFTTNWFAHPYAGSMYYSSARSVGLSYWQSAAYTVGGTAMWEYFGEVLPPSLNDFFTNILGGFHLGEVIHRLSENILDDRTNGKKRRQKEILNFLVNPIGEANRIMFGLTNDHHLHRNHIHRNLEMKISLMGLQILNTNVTPDQRLLPIIELDIIYGNLEDKEITISPFDIFWFKGWIRFDKRNDKNENAFPLPYWNMRSTAILHGKRKVIEKRTIIYGLFQDYDYIKTHNYELGSLGFSGGWLLTKATNDIFSNLKMNLGVIALGATDSGAIDLIKPRDPDAFRDYTMGSGYFIKMHFDISSKKYGSLKLNYDHWMMWTLSGPKGKGRVHFTDIEYSFPISKRIELGMAHNLYVRKGLHSFAEENIAEKNKSSELKFILSYSL